MAQPVLHYPPPWLSSPTLSSPLQQLLRLPVSSPLFEYVVDRLVDTVSAALDRSWDEGQQRSLRTPFLLPFVQNVLTKNRVSVATILVALVYLDRSRKNLRVSAGFWACERALVGAMILANKYTNDDILSTKAWAISSTIFTSRDVVKAEREFLQVLRYDLSVTEDQLIVHRVPLLMKVRDFAARHMVLKSAPHPHRAAAVRYCPYQTTQRPSATQAHVRRLVTHSATSSSSSLSPLDSPQLQTPPDPHPYSLAATGSELKRTYQSASLALPYVLAQTSYDTPIDAPVHAVDARYLTSLFRTSSPYSHTSRKDFGDRPDKIPPPPHSGRLQQLDSNILSLPRSATEVRPPRVSPEKAKYPQQQQQQQHGAYELGRFTLGADWYLHREQATTTPPSFENTATVCAF